MFIILDINLLHIQGTLRLFDTFRNYAKGLEFENDQELIYINELLYIFRCIKRSSRKEAIYL